MNKDTLYEIWTCKGIQLAMAPKLTPDPVMAGRLIEQLHNEVDPDEKDFEIWLRTWTYIESEDGLSRVYGITENVRIY